MKYSWGINEHARRTPEAERSRQRPWVGRISGQHPWSLPFAQAHRQLRLGPLPRLGLRVFVDSISGRSTETLSCVRNLEAATAPAGLFFCLGVVTILVAIIVKVMTKPALIKPDWYAAKKDRPSFVAELEKLAAIKAAGAITTEEFDSSKAVLLSRAK